MENSRCLEPALKASETTYDFHSVTVRSNVAFPIAKFSITFRVKVCVCEKRTIGYMRQVVWFGFMGDGHCVSCVASNRVNVFKRYGYVNESVVYCVDGLCG